MGFADMLINAVHAALEDREIALDGVGGDYPIALKLRRTYSSLLWLTVSCDLKFQPISTEGRSFIGHEVALGRSVVFKDRARLWARTSGMWNGVHAAVPLDQRKDRVHVAPPPIRRLVKGFRPT